MSVTPQEILQVKTFLEQRFVSTSSEWIGACITFLKEEHNQTLSLQNLKDYVYQQWLDADLEEIGVSSLPQKLVGAQKITLNGCFALQVEGIRDIGRPAYSQLKELDKDVNTNAEFSAAPEQTLPLWESKPTRMLMLNLTDGCIHVQGMEYKPINILSPNLPPGTKVLIRGPVDCRFGILLLTSDKIKILGGEVESKLIMFSRKAILREALQLPPEVESESVPSDDLSDAGGSNSVVNQPNPSAFAPHGQYDSFQNDTSSTLNMHSNNLGSGNQNPRRDTRNNQNINDSNNSIRRKQTTLPFSRQQNNFSSRNNVSDLENIDNLEAFEEDDEFEQILDYGALDEIEKESLNKSNEDQIPNEEPDIWAEDEDMVQDMLAFQDEDPGFQFPFAELSNEKTDSKVDDSKPFTYLFKPLQNPSSDCTVTIKGFIITVLSKLECTREKGWSLMVKINDGTATLDVNIHDKVLENIIGISASDVINIQSPTYENPGKRKEVMEAISKCKKTLQNYNCLMDVKFTPGSKPCLVKAYPMSPLHVQQLRQRVEFSS
ncbi:RecQ-mediated genome instability protein 1 like protein [Argiope bruennichi]|uniref:RecQ-mediated genome instability protein 1 n=1 Tax=Argiope bruennichi TaxID=94029 RepID=A0A8T0ESA2_ARGBR|nr:RecQ-mediated genome instability protein 1 like protein [Argiope bruennichi]